MRTYALPMNWDEEKVGVEIATLYLPVIIAALNHCARKSHRNVLREIGHSILSLNLVLERFEEIVAMEELYGREEVDPQND